MAKKMIIRREDSLEYHATGKPGKIEIVPTKPVSTVRDLSLAYSPGVAYPCLAIAEDVNKVYDYTARGNLVAVISNGTAVLGLGNIGPEASKPVMEGKAVLFKKYADIDSVDIELRSTDIEEFITVVKALEPTFGGINLEDIKAPECFEIEQRLRELLHIPIMHDDQHGTAIISAAALLNALELQGKRLEDVRVTVCGAGAAAISCTKLYLELGLKLENLVMVDIGGPLTTDRTDLDPMRAQFATSRTELKTLADAMVDADVFIGLSAGNIVSAEMVQRMAPKPIIFALANPEPEINYELARAARPDSIVATGRSDYPNQVNNVLGFPYIFRGALDVRATQINEAMKLGAVHAIAQLARESVPPEVVQVYGQHLSFGPEYLIPKPMDSRLITTVSMAVARAAMESGVAQHPITDWHAYEEQLMSRLGLNKGLMRIIIARAQRNPKRIVMPEANNYKILKAAQILIDEGIAQPILLGQRRLIEESLQEFEIELPDVQIIDPQAELKQRKYFADLYFKSRQRKGLTPTEALHRMRYRNYYGAMMVAQGMADGMICGLTEGYASALVPALEVIGLEPGLSTCAGLYIMNSRHGIHFFADCTINRLPDADRLVEIALLTARAARYFNVEPRIAMLSYSNFGSSKDPMAQKVIRATERLHREHPELIVDGDIQANVALRPDLMQEFFPFTKLAEQGANTFIFPSLGSANISYKLLQELGDVEAIGPVLLGLAKPVHVLQMGCSVREIVNMAALVVVDAQGQNEFF